MALNESLSTSHKGTTMSDMRNIGAIVIAAATSTAGAQPSPTAAERECAQAVQGKVAWNQSGNRQWQPGNVAQLCAGVVDVPARIECFQKEVKRHDDWSRAITACTAAAPSPGVAPAPASAPAQTVQTTRAAEIDLTGKWTQLPPDGGGSGGFGDLVTVRQKGRAFIAEIDQIDYSAPANTPPKRSTVRGEVRGGSVHIAGQREIARFEDNGRILRFADGSSWVRRP